MDPIKVEIGNFREVDKGAWKGTFSLIIYPQGQKILECRYFQQGDKSWFSFPQKECAPKVEGGKKEYIPYVSYTNKPYQEALKEAVVKEIAKYKESNGQKNSATSQTGQTREVYTQPPTDWL